MAKFIINSLGDRAVRKEQVRTLLIDYDPAIEGDNPQDAMYNLRVHFNIDGGDPIIFETDATLVGLQGKAATVLAALET